MRLHQIEASNWLAHSFVKIDLEPLTIVCGPNMRGKSSIRDAVAYALRHPTPRVAQARSEELRTEGTDKGYVAVKIGDGSVRREIGSTKVKADPFGSGARLDALPVLVDPDAFARLDPESRRVLLMRAIGAEHDIDAVLRKLVARGHGETVKNLPIAAETTADDWAKAATGKAQQARADWKAQTGEAYGAKKADTWTAKMPDQIPAARDLQAAAEEVEMANAALARAHRDEGARAAVRREVLAEGERQICPSCGCYLEVGTHGRLVESPPASLRSKADDPPADGLFGATPAGPTPAQSAQRALDEARSSYASIEADFRAAETAEERTRKAAQAHKRVVAWTAVAELLAPTGIPGEILAEGLQPLNDQLRTLAVANRWPQVSIGADMEVRAGGRRYALLAESEAWRASATLAVALAIESGVGMVMLDRLDVLDVPSRGPALGWLHGLVRTGKLDTVALFGTLKEAPVAPPGCKVVWLGAGEPAQAAAA